MADSKISGLAAVAAFATTQEFAVNDSGTSKKISGAQLIAALPQGTLPSGYAQVTAGQTPITAQVDLTGLTVTVNCGTGRRVRITGQVELSSSVATDSAAMYIIEDVTQIQSAPIGALTNTTTAYLVTCQAIIANSNGTHTFKLQAARTIGSGNVTMSAAATSPAFILVEDIGT